MRTLKWKELHRIEQVMLLISWGIKFTIGSVLIASVISNDWLWAFSSALILVISFIPAMLEQSFKIIIPLELDLSMAIFLLLSYGLGEYRGFYEILPWWDTFLHLLGSLLLALLGFYLVYTLILSKRIRIPASFVALFTFCFALSMGALWEILEYAIDAWMGTTMQLNSLVDTMWDLINDMISSVLVAAIAYIYVAKPEERIEERVTLRRKFIINK